MGEAKRKREMSIKDVARAIGVETMKGRIQVKWDISSSAIPFGQMAFFIEFLKLTDWQDNHLIIALCRPIVDDVLLVTDTPQLDLAFVDSIARPSVMNMPCW